MRRPAGVLHERGPTRGEIAFRAIAEPARARRDVGMLGDAEFGLRAVDEVTVRRRRLRDAHRIDGRPAVVAKKSLRAVDRELEGLRRPRGQIDVLDELLVLVAA